MKKIVYILETHEDKNTAYLNKDEFFSEWAFHLANKLPCAAYMVDYSNYDDCSYKEYQDELEDLIMFSDRRAMI